VKAGIKNTTWLARRAQFIPDHEQELREEIYRLAKLFLGPKPKELRCLAYDSAFLKQIFTV